MNKGFCDLGFAKVDTDRVRRRGYPEAVYCPGKTKEQVKAIAGKLVSCGQDALLTKLEKGTAAYLKKAFPALRYNPPAKFGYLASKKTKRRVARRREVAVICAGTSDIPIAEEAAATLEALGMRPVRLYDVGVAGVHRLTSNLDTIRDAGCIIVVAGMEGALASFVSGLTARPVIAVPTSSGYGANFSGLSALLTMLNCCSPGVAVMNIDNGFGAGYFASLIQK